MLAERHQHVAGEARMVQEGQAVGQHAAEDQKAPGWLGKVAAVWIAESHGSYPADFSIKIP